MEVKTTLNRIRNFKYILLIEGIAVGLITGIIVSSFRLLINSAESGRNWLIGMVEKNGNYLVYAGILAAVWAIICICVKIEKNCSGSGIPQIKGELAGQIETVWWRILLCKIVGGVLAIGAGLSVGREGPSVQLGAMTGKGFSRLTGRIQTEERLLITCGSGAGLAAAFSAPLAGVVFSLEEIHKNLSIEVLLASMAAAVSSDFVATYIFGFSPVFSISPEYTLPLKNYWMLLIFGVVLGVVGAAYNRCIAYIQKFYSLIKPLYIRIAIPLLCAGVLAFTYPYVLGGGSDLVTQLAQEHWLLGSVIFLFVVKFVFSMVSFGSGSPGGIFLPLLVMGSLLGTIFAQIAGADAYIDNFIILGMAGYFAAIVKSPITGIILINEMTGNFSNLLSLSVVSLVAYVISDLLKSKPVYDQLLERILAGQGKKLKEKKKNIMLDSCIQFGALMDGKELQELGVPKGCLIISIERNGREFVPDGTTVMQADDNLLLLCDEAMVYDVEQLLARKCRVVSERKHRREKLRQK